MKLGLAHLTAIDLPPAALARAARAHGFDEIGLRLAPAMAGGAAYPLPAASADAAAFRRVADGEGIAVADVEFVALTPTLDVATLVPLLAAGADLGARSLTVSGDDPEPARLTARFAALCELARGFGLRVDLEFMRFRSTATFDQALAVVQAAAQDNGAVLLDTLHFHRAGGDAATLDPASAAMVRSVQISDAPAFHPLDTASLITEARTARLAPGAGQLPLLAILRACPAAAISVEAPNDRLAMPIRLQQAHDGARAILAKAAGTTP